MKILRFTFLSFFALSCQHLNNDPASLNSSLFRIIILDESKTFENEKPLEFSLFFLKNNELYASNFASIHAKDFKNFINKRKNIFLNLFSDDVDPYTGTKNERKICLKKINLDSIEFFSGAKNNWADCQVNSNKKHYAIRQWILCQETAWEVTAKLSPMQKLSFECR